MKLHSKLLLVGLTAAAVTSLVTHSLRAAGKTGSARDYLKGVQTGGLKLGTLGAMNFGPHGLLLVAEPRTASILAIDTGDTGPARRLAQRIPDVATVVEGALGAPAGGAKIIDLAVNPASGKIYLAAVRSQDSVAAIVVISPDGKASMLDTAKAAWVRVGLPAADQAKIGNITDVGFAGDRVLAAGASSEEFSSKIFSLALPLAHGQGGAFYSAETFHVAHNKWETKAPISSFIPYEEDGKHYVVGAFACTPIAKFPLDDLKSGANVKGTSVVELGSGNRPLDMFTYDKGGKRWLVTHTQRMGERAAFGPSKFWSARVDLKYLSAGNAENVNQKAARRDTAKKSGPEGIEIVDSLFGAVHLDKFNNDEAVVLREDGAKLVLEMAKLP